MNKVIQVISSRVSCRSYSDKKVPKGKLSQILEAGKFAPSGMNKQVCNILVIKSKSVLEKIRLALKEKFNRDCLYGAPHLCLVKGNENEPLLVQDASCILENMFVAATALKVDSCWINQLDELLKDPKYLKLRKRLGLAEEDRVVGSIVLGYRKEGTRIDVKARKEDFIKYL